MNFRITPNRTTELALSQLASQAARLHSTQQQLSSGLRLQKPSDDPLAVRKSLIQQDQLSLLEARRSSIQHSESRLNQAHVQLREAQQLYVKARSVALSARQTSTTAERQTLAAEVQGILDQLVSVANAADESGYLFSGTATQTKPFTVNGTGPGAVTYQGAESSTTLYLADDVARESLVAGDRIFQPRSRETTVIHGSTGVALGTGTDTATGVRQLQLDHTLTTYQGTSGVTAGTSSVTGDTVLGSLGTHQLQITDTSGTGSGGTISLNGGVAVAFTNSDTDLQVTGLEGEIVYVNTTSIAAGFAGTVDLVADGSVSLDGGLTSQAITFATGQTVTDSRDGGVLHLDTTSVVRPGDSIVEFPGTADAFQALQALKDDLLNTRGLTEAELNSSLDQRLADIDRIENHLLDELGIQSVSLQQLDRLSQRTQELQLTTKSAYAELTAADMAAAALELQETLNLQQFTMASVSRLLSPSLLDFIR